MIRRVRRASALGLLLLGLASTGFAADADSTAAPIGLKAGRGALGGQIGGSFFAADDDYSAGAQPRLAFAGHFRYVMSPGTRWQVSPSYSWAAYANDEDLPFPDPNFPADTKKDQVLAQVAGASIQIQKVWGSGRSRWHLGAGPGIYRVWVQNRRKVLKDPVSKELHRRLHLGASAELGWERWLKALPNTSIEVTGAVQTAFAKDDDKYPSGFNGNPMVAELRVGAHYYYEFRKKKPDDKPAGAR
jgi:hypothetical protein